MQIIHYICCMSMYKLNRVDFRYMDLRNMSEKELRELKDLLAKVLQVDVSSIHMTYTEEKVDS